MSHPTLSVQAVRELFGWSVLVLEDGVPVAGCTHRHPTTASATLCGGRMAREIIVERTRTDEAAS